jgi:hypothetical protein
VFVHDEKKARGACEYWRHQGQVGRAGGCDQPILLGNDPLYGGLGGEFTCVKLRSFTYERATGERLGLM